MLLNSVYISILLTVVAWPSEAMAHHSETKLYMAGIWFNLVGEQVKSILATGNHEPASCWVTWAIGNSLYKSYDVVQHFL
jgi:hypothetical protein